MHLITVFLLILIHVGFFTCSNSSVFYCGENISFTLNLSVPGGFITVIGAHDSMITIKNGGNAIYGATM